MFPQDNPQIINPTQDNSSENFRVLSLDEIRQSRKRKSDVDNTKASNDFKILTLDEIRAAKKRLSNSNQEIEVKNEDLEMQNNNGDFKVMSLSEIRALKVNNGTETNGDGLSIEENCVRNERLSSDNILGETLITQSISFVVSILI